MEDKEKEGVKSVFLIVITSLMPYFHIDMGPDVWQM